jgi:hypothetical protein
MGGSCSACGEEVNAYSILARKYGRKRAFERTRLSWEGNIKMCARELGWEGVDGINLA